MMRLWLYIFGTLILPLNTFATVWDVKQNWDAAWETKYSKWISEEYTEDFFINLDLPSNCSTAVYVARAVFSFKHGLPFMAHDQLRPSIIYTNLDASFDDLDRQERFMKFLEFITSRVSTISFQNDSYPLNLEYVSAGDFYVTDAHTFMITQIDLDGLITGLSSTMPTQLRRLKKEMFSNVNPPDRWDWTGFRRFLPLKVSNQQICTLDVAKEPGYCIRPQRSFPADLNGDGREEGYFLEVARKLNKTDQDLDVMKILQNLIEGVTKDVQQRVDIVLQSDQTLLKRGNNFIQGSEDYENYSTPNLDEKIRNKLSTIATMKDGLSDLSSNWMREQLEPIEIDIGRGVRINLYYVYWQIYYRMSSNPNDEFYKRWGLNSDLSPININHPINK